MALSPAVVRARGIADRTSTSSIGMIMFLGSWAMMFAALFFSYAMLRVRAPIWPPFGEDPLPLGLPGLNTCVLLLSSVSVHLAMRELRRDNLERFRSWMITTLVLGAAFVALQLVVWIDLWNTGLTIRSGIYGSLFYTLTAFHALHVVVGVGLLVWLAAPALRPVPRPPSRIPVHIAALFWHFVDVVWIVMFLAVYVF